MQSLQRKQSTVEKSIKEKDKEFAKLQQQAKSKQKEFLKRQAELDKKRPDLVNGEQQLTHISKRLAASRREYETLAAEAKKQVEKMANLEKELKDVEEQAKQFDEEIKAREKELAVQLTEAQRAELNDMYAFLYFDNYHLESMLILELVKLRLLP